MDSVKIDTAILDQMIRDAPGKAGGIVHKFGLAITGDAAQNAPVDTAALRNSITSESQMVDALNFIVQDGVKYGVFQELGTSRMAAHPFMVPAVEHRTNGFFSAFAELFGFHRFME